MYVRMYSHVCMYSFAYISMCGICFRLEKKKKKRKKLLYSLSIASLEDHGFYWKKKKKNCKRGRRLLY